MVSKTTHNAGQQLRDVCDINIKKIIDEYKDGDKIINFRNIYIKDYDEFNVSSYIHVFNVEYVTSMTIYENLSNDTLKFINLREIVFSRMLRSKYDISYLGSLKFLEVIKFDFLYYEDLSVLKEIKNLKVLKLFINKNNSSIIKDLKNLEELNLIYPSYDRTNDEFTITLQKNLKTFVFMDQEFANYKNSANYLIDFERCERLKHVTFGTENSPIVNPIGLGNVRTLILKNCKHVLNDDNAKFLTNVISLNINSKNGYDCDVQYIRYMTSLKYLYFNKVYITSDMNAISSIKTLRSLSLSTSIYTDSLADGLVRLTSLTSLYLEFSFMDNAKFIGSLVHLQHLKLNDFFNRSIKFLKDLPLKTIKFGIVFNKDINDMPSTLEEIVFGQMFNKKIDRLKDIKNLRSLTLGKDFSESLIPLSTLEHFDTLIINHTKKDISKHSDYGTYKYVRDIPLIKNLKTLSTKE
jgi:hypothetical protein